MVTSDAIAFVVFRRSSAMLLALLVASASAQNHSPATPDITEPRVGRIVNPSDVHMETGPFSDPDAGDQHRCTDWEIWQAAPLVRVWITACIGGVERVHTHLGDGVFEGPLVGRRGLDANTDYLLRVRHRDDSNDAATEWSAWAERSFTTGAASTLFPLELDDILATPIPTLRTPVGAPVVLPAGATAGSIRVEVYDAAEATFGLVLEVRGSAAGNTLNNPPALGEHGNVRVSIQAGSAALNMPDADLSFVTDDGVTRTVYIAAQSLAAGTTVYYWVADNGGTYSATAAQTAPDFSSLVRGPAVPWSAASDVKVEIVATGFQLPVSIAFVPAPGPLPSDPLYYVGELYGSIKVVSRDGTVSDYATGLLNYNPTGNFPGSGEQGLGCVVVDPTNGDVYATLLRSDNPADDNAAHHPRVVRFSSTDGGRTAASQTLVIDMAPEAQGQSHQISNITFGPDSQLYVHVGDGFDASAARNLTQFRGKILRMTRGGQPVSTNPYYNAADGITARDYIYASGVRNPFGGAWRAADQSHFFVENGPSVDRFARLVAGRDYGYDGSDQSMSNFALYNWNPSTAPVNITFIQATTFAGSGFPVEYYGRAYVTQSGGTFAGGPGSPTSKSITEWVINGSGQLVSGPRAIAFYNGGGQSSVAAIAAGPDGLYFSDLYKEDSPNNPIAPGANILRIRYSPPPPPPDCDGDGIPDSVELANGSALDCDGNGIPDDCEIAGGAGSDCNGNGLLDECEATTQLVYDFNNGQATPFVLNGDATVSGGAIRLTNAIAGRIGSANRPPLSASPMTEFRVRFDFRIGNGSGADGMSFSAFDAARYNVNAIFSEEGPGSQSHTPAGPGSITVQFDTYDNGGEGENSIELQYDGERVATYAPTFDMEDFAYHHADVLFRDNRVTVRVTNAAGVWETAHDNVLIPGYTPFVALYGFGGRAGGLTNEHWVDNVAFTVPSSSDSNGDGVLDVCECPGDVNRDHNVTLTDLAILLSHYGNGGATAAEGDIDLDGDVDLSDLSRLLANFGVICP